MKQFLTLFLVACMCAPFGRGADPALTLADARAMALRNHPQIAIADLRRKISDEIVRINKASYFPNAEGYFDAVQAGNSNTRILAGGLNNPVIYDRVADGIAVSQLITDFGQTKNLVASARFSAKAAEESAAATNETILLNVEVSYFRALSSQAVLDVARQTVEARETVARQIEALERNQLKSALDLSFAQVAVDQAHLMFLSAENDCSAAQASLSEALGLPDDQAFGLAPVALPNLASTGPERLIAVALEKRPDAVQLKYEGEAARHYALSERDRNFPTIKAIGTAGNALSHDARLPNRYAAGGLAVDIPLFAGGEYLAREHEAELQARVEDESLKNLQIVIARDVRIAWLNLGTSSESLKTTESLVRHAEQAYNLAQAKYKVGSSSIAELTDAQLAATSAQIAMASARYDFLIRNSILAYQTGNL